MTIDLGIIMDPIESIKVYKDTTFAMLLAAQARGWRLHYMQLGDLYMRDGRSYGRMQALHVQDDSHDWFSLGEATEGPLTQLDGVLMRKDPPFDLEYLYATQLLELAEREGCPVFNRPAALRDANEKLFTAWFPQCCPPTLVSRDIGRCKAFLQEIGEAVAKPLDNMGGAMVFRLEHGHPNVNVILETLTDYGRRTVMVQRFLPEYRDGDKRILLIDGDPVPYALARMPAEGESRANLAMGGRGIGVDLTPRDRWICEQVGPILRDKGLVFVGLDVIGDYLTEINVTSPTCIRELDAIYGLDIAGQLMAHIEPRLAS